MAEIKLTKEQTEFLAKCEEEFKDRFTDKDEAFMKVHTAKLRRPPIIEPWYNKSRRNYDWSRQSHRHDQNRRNRTWDRSDREKNDKVDRHAGKHHMYHRDVNKPY